MELPFGESTLSVPEGVSVRVCGCAVQGSETRKQNSENASRREDESTLRARREKDGQTGSVWMASETGIDWNR